MANIKLGGGVTDIRGSIGGTTFSRGPAGAIARQRVKVINPRSALQVARRAVASSLAQHWSQDLDAGERADWNAYAAATDFTNKVGDTIQISGLACFVRLNSLRMLMGLAVQETAPLSAGMAATVVCSVGAVYATGKVQVGEPSAGFDKTDPLEFLVVFAGLPMKPGRTQSPRGHRYVGFIQGNAVPPVFAVDLGWPYAAQTGDNYPMRIVHIDNQSRVASPLLVNAVVIAA
jgi:hypothetical protein